MKLKAFDYLILAIAIGIILFYIGLFIGLDDTYNIDLISGIIKYQK